MEGNYYLKRAQHKVIHISGCLYSPNITTASVLLNFICINELNVKEVAFADDFMVAGKISSIKDYWSQLTSIGPKYGYFPKTSKSYLIVKEDRLPNATT